MSSVDLTKIDESVLRAELARREQEADKIERARRTEVASEVLKHIDILLNTVARDHGRTSCSDEDPNNHWFSRKERRVPRCIRCYLLSMKDLSYNTRDNEDIGLRLTAEWLPDLKTEKN